MKSTLITFVAAGLVVWAAVKCSAQQSGAMDNPAIQNPAVQNPAAGGATRGGTTPVSMYQNSLTRTPNPLSEPTGNLIVTGNVAGGKYFRGVVPYNATSDIANVIGTSSLDNFMRDSAGVSGYGIYEGGIRPYYFERRTVTGITVGTTQVYRPPIPQISYGTPAGFLEPSLAQPQPVRIPAPTITNLPLRPMSMTADEWEKRIARDIEKYPQFVPEEKLSEEEYEKQMSRLREDLRDLSGKTEELKQNLLVEEEAKEKEEKPVYEQPVSPLEVKKEEEVKEEETKEPDVFQEVDQQAEEFKKMMEERKLKAEEEAKKEGEEAPEEKEGEEEQKKPVLEESSVIDRSVRARSILGEHGTFASFAAARFKEHMEAGDKLMKEGKYYRAADSYTMASLYNRTDAKAYAMKSYALFAAGEYMSSALFLARALESPGDYVNEKVDIVGTIGDRDRIESRVADAEQWFKRSQAPELEFLLGYMYYRLGRMSEAKQAIGVAFEKMPDSAAVATLKKAIEGPSN